MAVDNVVNTSSDLVSGLIADLGRIGLWLQALGLLIVLWLIFQIIALIVNRKKRRTLYAIKDDLERVESKIDKMNSNIEKLSKNR